jgi:segregation and condensation protein A
MLQLTLPTYHGPLDLLLYLVRKNEVDILDLSLAAVADQFLDYVRAVQAIDVEAAGDFLVTAASLMEIKARSLLPADPKAEEDEADPRRELVKQLLEYRKFKDASAALERQAATAATRVPRTHPPEPPTPGLPTVRAVELWDLVSAFARLMRETQTTEPATLQADETPQAVYEAEVRRAVAGGRVAFRDVFAPPHLRPRLIGLFLAVLELLKRREIGVEQPEAFGEVWVLPA